MKCAATRCLASFIVTGLAASTAGGQSSARRPPVIDMHVHSTTVTPNQLPRLDSLNVRYLFLAGLAAELRGWAAVDTTRFLAALVLPCDNGRAPITGRSCFNSSADFPDTAWLRGELRAGRIRGLGELVPQYLGISPSDSRLEPYWRLAEEFDVPVGIHMGPGPPGVAYESSSVLFKSPAFRMALGDPLLLEDVLLRHKRLRLFVMHAGYPRLEPMLALMSMYPNVYVDVAALQSTDAVPRAAYYRYLRGLVEGGFAKRIMFGSDFPRQTAPGIDAILAAEHLSDEQKSDILCGNAARFLRLRAGICEP